MKSKIIFLVVAISLLPNFMHAMEVDLESGHSRVLSVEDERETVRNKIAIMRGQCSELAEYIEKEEVSYRATKNLDSVPHVKSLKESLQRQSVNIETLASRLLEYTEAVPNSDLLTFDTLDVSRVKHDVSRLFKNEDITDPIEKTAFTWLLPYKSALPSKINPYYITGICTAIPVVFSLAAILSADDKAMRKEIVMGVCKVGLVASLSGYFSYYGANIWNPFRIKLDNGIQGDSEQRIMCCGKSIECMNTEIARYCEHLHARKTGNDSRVASQYAAAKAIEARDIALTTNLTVGALGSKIEEEKLLAAERDKQARLRDQAHAQRLGAVKERQDEMLRKFDILFEEFQKMNQNFRGTKTDFLQYFQSEGRARELFEANVMQEVGDLKWIAVQSWLQGQKQLHLTEAMIVHHQVPVKAIECGNSVPQRLTSTITYASGRELPSLGERIDPNASRSKLKEYITNWNSNNYTSIPSTSSASMMASRFIMSRPKLLKKDIEVKFEKIPDPIKNESARLVTSAIQRKIAKKRTDKLRFEAASR